MHLYCTPFSYISVNLKKKAKKNNRTFAHLTTHAHLFLLDYFFPFQPLLFCFISQLPKFFGFNFHITNYIWILPQAYYLCVYGFSFYPYNEEKIRKNEIKYSNDVSQAKCRKLFIKYLLFSKLILLSEKK